MSAQVQLLPAAEGDLDEQAEYLTAQAGLKTGLRYYAAVDQTLLILAEQPALGSHFHASKTCDSGRSAALPITSFSIAR